MTAPGVEVDGVAHARILVVEDEKIIARDIQQTLRNLDYEVIGTVDGPGDAVRHTLEARPDLVLMDIRLRGEADGIQAATEIRERTGLPVVFLTAFADEATLQRASAATPYGYVLKPFDERDLHVAILMALCKHRAFLELDQRVRERTAELVRSEARVRQMVALADLGVFALQMQELQPVLERSMGVITETLDVPFVNLAELLADGSALVLRAGLGWPPGLVGSTRFPTERSSQPGFTLLCGAPVLMERLDTERRFTPTPLLRDHDVVSGASVVIFSPGDARPYGALCVHTTTPRSFDANEISFLQAVANLLGTTVARVSAEQRRLRAERAAENERTRAENAQQAIRARDEFLTIASHELKTPLTALQLQLQSLSARRAALDPRVATRLERASKSTDRLASLVEALLDVSRFSTGRIELREEELVLQEVTRDVLERVSEAAAKACCDVRLENHAARLVGRWDRVRLEQMLLNLLSNCFKYAAGKPVEVVVERVGDWAEVVVTDHGPGISPEHADRIFQRFERAASIQHFGGLGLGLYITRQLAEAHGGSVSLRNTAHAGASFILRLPLESRIARESAPSEVLP